MNEVKILLKENKGQSRSDIGVCDFADIGKPLYFDAVPAFVLLCLRLSGADDLDFLTQACQLFAQIVDVILNSADERIEPSRSLDYPHANLSVIPGPVDETIKDPVIA